MFASLLIVTFHGSGSKRAAGSLTTRSLLRTTLVLVRGTSRFVPLQDTAGRYTRLGCAAVVDIVTRIDVPTVTNFVPFFYLENRSDSVTVA